MEDRSFYLNLTILNKDEIVQETVKKKAGTGIFGKAMGYAASSVVSDKTIVEKTSKVLLEKIPIAISEMGIEGDMVKEFEKDAYMVLKITIKSTDKYQLFKATKGEEYASKFNELLACLNALDLNEALAKIDDTVLTKVHENMMQKFAEVVPAKMSENGINVDCCVCSCADQAAYLFDRLKTLP